MSNELNRQTDRQTRTCLRAHSASPHKDKPSSSALSGETERGLSEADKSRDVGEWDRAGLLRQHASHRKSFYSIGDGWQKMANPIWWQFYSNTVTPWHCTEDICLLLILPYVSLMGVVTKVLAVWLNWVLQLLEIKYRLKRCASLIFILSCRLRLSPLNPVPLQPWGDSTHPGCGDPC